MTPAVYVKVSANLFSSFVVKRINPAVGSLSSGPRLRSCPAAPRPPAPRAYLAVRSCVDPVVVHPPFVSQRDGPLPGAALTLPHQEATVDPTAQQVLGSVAGHRPVVPGMFLQAVDGCDVVAGNPPLAIFGLGFTPFAIVIVA